VARQAAPDLVRFGGRGRIVRWLGKLSMYVWMAQVWIAEVWMAQVWIAKVQTARAGWPGSRRLPPHVFGGNA